MSYLADRLRQGRQAAGLSQKELGEKLGISEMAISAYETCWAIPPLPALKKISKITKLPVVYFIEDSNKNVSLESLHSDVQDLKKSMSQILKFIKAYDK